MARGGAASASRKDDDLSARKRRLFGTDGIRGMANEHPMTSDLAVRLGRAIAHRFQQSGRHRTKVLVGKDTRLSGYMIETALASGLCSGGADVMLVGPLPTPGVAFLTAGMRADAGAMISASHNPFHDNGIKLFGADGFKLPDAVEHELEQLIESEVLPGHRPKPGAIGRAHRIDDAAGRYSVFAKSAFPRDLDLEGLKLVVDCAHGAGYRVAPEVFRELGAEVTAIGVEPNGTNINARCGALYPETMAAEVRRVGADLGIALDGDADRCIFSDEHGNVVDGDHIMALVGRHLIEHGDLADRTVVATVMSNIGLERSLAQVGGRLVRAAVGDRYVVERMRRDGLNFGGEQSGHLIWLDHSTTGDGLVTALAVLGIAVQSQRPLSELTACMKRYPQVLRNHRVARKRPLSELPTVQAVIRGVEERLGDEGRVLVRYSGTEMLVRVMVEGIDDSVIGVAADEIGAALESAIGAGA